MPYLPQATLEQILAYRPDDAATHTPSPIVNAVAETLYTTLCIDCISIAQHLSIDERKLSAAISLETGLHLKDIIQQYRLAQLKAFMDAHPEQDYTLDEMAHALGYSSGKSIYRFIHTQTGLTPRGHKSIAETDSFVKIRSEIRRKRLEK